ncbi:hypothetical protein AMTRI_Chr12g274910 [Amborella trichopoda]|uniref:Reverse transcriptase domain-containing protein n=1 Tax=Amborella trichopoda TaxID=13333 RepID=W1PJV3_AMBTC|nr:uncharacterized protein LOC18435599 [Amborella trichopoda]XP_020523744.1 uncharacterized protein LOC18435599 [Amborella trichopoda]XP_020523745.1 uncharacterized protein LOC18435599 [Amborella trichopoda]XP_020523746.1 uncharacterized protein LOC18435599 [Amborella trichopoda]XP_020523747.1 uncharacterized protein LOC18435599 [Amborella trichopoda]XP_020523748.1 uncharacterized protein LOC18435599 [Amborella trichopoda]XP_020523749.1 uncharacterized protein LOC18435599 [Amborella trichopod|eukprot:XP_006845705.3 uncharacterized protein LOC18435599 [Amborella trichopoda]
MILKLQRFSSSEIRASYILPYLKSISQRALTSYQKPYFSCNYSKANAAFAESLVSEPSEVHDETRSMSRKDIEILVLKQYSNGKFHNLVENVVSCRRVLLAACENLDSRVNGENRRDCLFSSVGVWVRDISEQIKAHRFDVDAYCVEILPLRKKGEKLILPSLKLKVVIEALRMVLEVIYENRFSTFAYGGRVGMGRHTCLRYLKNNVKDPNWWFSVAFKRDKINVNKLVSIMEEKMEDDSFMEILKGLFALGVISIEFGGCYMGRGFPQESGISSILVNVYFNGFDNEIQEIRTRIAHMNPEIETKGIPNVFYKPVKVFALRYLDEILVISSETKIFTMDLKKQVVEFLEGVLEMKVDKAKTAIHSAVSEKLGFIGMEIQAVPPSVLRPPMSEKAIRARKKYIKQRQARALEARNAYETRLKKLGLKIFSHVFMKFKKMGGFNCEAHIAPQIREIFEIWSHDVIEEFFKSSYERWTWYRRLAGGEFLSLQSVRDQLPQELVESYDQFHEQVDKYLNPYKINNNIEEERECEEEEARYSERTVRDLTELYVKVDAPTELIRKAVKLAGFTNSMGRPKPIKLLIPLDDADIIKWYAGIGRRWLQFYCCSHNFKTVKTIVNYHLRFSCILTLAEKHESTKREAINHYSKDLKVLNMDGIEELIFPLENDIKMMGDKNLSDPKPVDGLLSMALVRLASDEPSGCCAAHFCDRLDTIAYRVRLLQSRLNVNPLDEEKWVPGMGFIHESLDRKYLSLCSKHISDLYLGSITLQDIDCTSCFIPQ